jgi:hypothetical protein
MHFLSFVKIYIEYISDSINKPSARYLPYFFPHLSHMFCFLWFLLTFLFCRRRNSLLHLMFFLVARPLSLPTYFPVTLLLNAWCSLKRICCSSSGQELSRILRSRWVYHRSLRCLGVFFSKQQGSSLANASATNRHFFHHTSSSKLSKENPLLP